jgi:protein-L-isoaspartate(D-aspartate) O-methyltransferase
LSAKVGGGEDLVGLARGTARRRRLSTTLVAVDGVHGLPAHAPFDRIIATSSVPAVPWEWAEQLATDGTTLVDLKLANSAGNLVHLHRVDDRLEGHFTTRWAAFTAMRTGAAPEPVSRADRATGGRTRPTDAPATPWTEAKVAWFLAQLRLPPGTSFGYDLDPDTRRPVATTFAAPNGSCAPREPH